MSFEHRVRVRYGETDQMGVVHHPEYLLYMEEARTAYMAHLGCPYSELERSGVGLAVRRVELRYFAGARYEEELRVTTHLERLRAASVSFRYEIERAADGARLVTGSTELACIDLTRPERPPRPLPSGLSEIVRRELAG